MSGTQLLARRVPFQAVPRTGTHPGRGLRASFDRTSTSTATCGYATSRAACANWHASAAERGSVLLSADETESPAVTDGAELPPEISDLLTEIATQRIGRVRRHREQIADFRADAQPRRDAAKARLHDIKLGRIAAEHPDPELERDDHE
jgi:hypothetical protein